MVQPAILLKYAQEVFYMNLSEKILYCRKKAGMSQLDLADALGVSKGGNAPIWHTPLRSKV